MTKKTDNNDSLFTAAKEGNVEKIKSLIKSGFIGTTTFKKIVNVDVILICVPTLLLFYVSSLCQFLIFFYINGLLCAVLLYYISVCWLSPFPVPMSPIVHHHQTFTIIKLCSLDSYICELCR